MPDDAMAPPRHEPQDVGAGFALRAVVLVAACLVAAAGILALVYPGTLVTRYAPDPLPQPPLPRLQSSPRTDMSEFYQQEMQRLNGAGWTDRGAGRVHIPIADAMRAIAAEGIAGWPEAQK